MATKTPKSPLLQLYFGEKPIRIEKKWKAWLGDPVKLEENLKIWHQQTQEVWKENQRLTKENNALKKEKTDLEQTWLQKEQGWEIEKKSLETKKDAEVRLQQSWYDKYHETLEYYKKVWVYLNGPIQAVRPIRSLDMLKWWLRKKEEPMEKLVDKDYWNIPELSRAWWSLPEKWRINMIKDPQLVDHGEQTIGEDTREPIVKSTKISTYLYEVKFWKKESINAKGELIVDNFWFEGEEYDGVFVEGKYADMKVLENLENESFIWKFDKYSKVSFFDRKFLIVYYDNPWTFTKISSQDTQTDETDTREPNIQKVSTIVKVHDTTWKQKGGLEAILELKVEPFHFKRVLFDGTILVKGREDEIKILENWKGKSINWSFDKFKTLMHYGNWKLTIYHTDYWKLVEVGEQEAQTDIHNLIFVDLERGSESFITQQVVLKAELLKESDADNLKIKLKELEVYFNFLGLPNTYQLLAGIYGIAIENKEKITQFLTSQEVASLDELGQKIKNLQLKNEKLSDSYKKLTNYFAEARKQVVHLQGDLQTEQQDKQHIQKELNDALTILNKPTSEIGTQTDLTAEQISQMEEDITKYQADIQTEQAKASQLTNQIDTLQGEIKDLQEQVRERELNETEKELLVGLLPKTHILSLKKEEEVKSILHYIESGTSDGNTTLFPLDIKTDWNQLRREYMVFKNKISNLLHKEMDRRNLEKKIVKLVKDKEELQTKYDMEVRSKEELVNYLTVYRSQNNYLQYNENDTVGLKEFINQHSSRMLNFFFIRLNKSKEIDFNLVKLTMYSTCSILSISHERNEEIILNNLPRKYKQGIDFYKDSFSRGEHLLLCNKDKVKINYV